MKTLIKIGIGFAVAPLLLTMVLLYTLQFQIMNTSFILNSLEANNTYEQIPKIVQAGLKEHEASMDPESKAKMNDIASKVTPELSRDIVTTNVTNFNNYLNGESKELAIYMPYSKLGIQMDPNNPNPQLQGDTIPWSTFSKQGNPTPINNIDEEIMKTWLISVVSLLGLTLLYAKLSRPWTHVWTLFLSTGLALLVVSIAALVFFNSANKELLGPGQEPAQYLIGILFGSVLKDIVTTWAFIGGGLVALSIAFFILEKVKYKKPAAKSPKRTYMRGKTA